MFKLMMWSMSELTLFMGKPGVSVNATREIAEELRPDGSTEGNVPRIVGVPIWIHINVLDLGVECGTPAILLYL